ncbi:MAG: hypothetical protein ACP5NF_03665 [Thermoanaerobaculum sp.]
MSDEELAYYRAVEDHFCRLRGTPFLFSPKDFAYLRRWWQEGVPLSAVLMALSEVFAKRRERGEDPVSSLAYCRHAVARQARRMAQARVGVGEEVAWDVGASLDALYRQVEAVRATLPGPRVKEVLEALAATLRSLPRDLPPATVEAMLAELEAQTLAAVWEALAPGEREQLQTQLRESFPEGAELSGRAWEVALWRAVREHLGLPRLELAPRGA